MTKQQWKEYLLDIGYIDTRPMDEPEYRLVREAISELGADGILFVPDKRVYTAVERLPIEEARKFANKQFAAWITQKTNKINPLFAYLSEENKKVLMGNIW